jgi:hypothetical protein
MIKTSDILSVLAFNFVIILLMLVFPAVAG